MITVSPAVVERTVPRGESRVVDIEVANQTRDPWSFDLGTQDVVPDSKARGGLRMVDAHAGGARAWLDARQGTFALAPTATAVLKVTITVPRNAAPGGHYASLYVQTRPRAGSVRIAARVSVLFLVTVDGDLRRDLAVSARPVRRVLLRDTDAHWRVELRNRGNVHEVFGGELRVRGLLGQRLRAPLRPMIVLPGTRRVQTVGVEARSAPDLLSGTVRWQLAGKETPAQHQDSRAAGRVGVLPWWALLVAAAAIGLVAWRRRRSAT